MDTVGNRCPDGVVKGRAATAGETHVGNSQLTRLMMIDHPVDAFDDIRIRTRIGAVEHPNGYEGDAFGDAVGSGTDESRRHGAVAGAVIGAWQIIDCRIARGDAATEFHMCGVHTRIEDVDGDVLSREVVAIPIVVDRRSLVDQVEPPCRAVPVVVDEHLLGGCADLARNKERRSSENSGDQDGGEAPTPMHQMSPVE
jgi:hypothetical protein